MLSRARNRLYDLAPKERPDFRFRIWLAKLLDPRPETCLQGGLTLVAMPGFERLAERIKYKIERGSIAKQQKRTRVDIVYPEFGEHANGEPWIKLPKDHIGGHDCMVLTSGPGTRNMMMDNFLLLYYLIGREARRITVVTAYYPLSRSDKDEGREILALAPFFAKMVMDICGEKLSKIIAVDLHASQLVLVKPGKITEVQFGRRLLKAAIREAQKAGKKFVIAFPDDGAKKRYEKILEKVEEELGIGYIPTVLASKRRASSTTSKVQDLVGDIEAIKDAIVITCDDEIATGGTNINAARAFIEDCGAAEVWALVPHGVLCGKAADNLSAPDCPLTKIFISDTIPTNSREALKPLIDSGRITVVTWWEDLAWLIYRHHWAESIRIVR